MHRSPKVHASGQVSGQTFSLQPLSHVISLASERSDEEVCWRSLLAHSVHRMDQSRTAAALPNLV
jgi:hypothetical protein